MGRVKEATITIEDLFYEALDEYNWKCVDLLYNKQYERGNIRDRKRVLDDVIDAARVYGQMESLAALMAATMGDFKLMVALRSIEKPLIFDEFKEKIQRKWL